MACASLVGHPHRGCKSTALLWRTMVARHRLDEAQRKFPTPDGVYARLTVMETEYTKLCFDERHSLGLRDVAHQFVGTCAENIGDENLAHVMEQRNSRCGRREHVRDNGREEHQPRQQS